MRCLKRQFKKSFKMIDSYITRLLLIYKIFSPFKDKFLLNNEFRAIYNFNIFSISYNFYENVSVHSKEFEKLNSKREFAEEKNILLGRFESMSKGLPPSQGIKFNYQKPRSGVRLYLPSENHLKLNLATGLYVTWDLVTCARVYEVGDQFNVQPFKSALTTNRRYCEPILVPVHRGKKMLDIREQLDRNNVLEGNSW